VTVFAYPEGWLLLFSSLYFVGLCGARWVWHRIPVFHPTQPGGHEVQPGLFPQITVVVAARNEAPNIEHLLTDLAQQTFAPFEVVVSDDHSEDQTRDLVEVYAGHAAYRLRLLRSLPAQVGKKMAVSSAIAIASGELIVLTDADCRVGKEWLATIWQFYKQNDPKIIVGPITLLPPVGLFAQLQVVEQVSLTVSGAVALALGHPNMANGANLAYPKSVFDEVGGFAGSAHIASGDDEFLLQKIAAVYPNQIQFLKSPSAIVRTLAQPSYQDFFQQRKRWASKWRQHGKAAVTLPALIVFMYHFVCGISIFYLISGYSVRPSWIVAAWLLKFCAEGWLLSEGLRFVGYAALAWGILVLQPMYSFYVVLMGIVANFGTYKWKGRKVKPQGGFIG